MSNINLKTASVSAHDDLTFLFLRIIIDRMECKEVRCVGRKSQRIGIQQENS